MERIDYPTTWCMTCQTTIAQADLDNVEMTSHFNDILFSCKGKEIHIATTRPEMLPACVALFYHPQDQRYNGLKNKFAVVPLFGQEVPILTDESVDPTKGTGLMMVCTFGDKDDVEKWHKYNLPLRVVFSENGTMNQLAGKYARLKIKDARKEILQELKEKGYLLNQKDISHAVNVHERCGTEIEFLKKQQWQIKVLDRKEELIELAQQINWYPEHMRVRYEHWVKNLQWNWGISRQRYYGVPFPVWYCTKCSHVLLPQEKDLPVDPREEKFKGKCNCGSTSIEGEMDIMDTWMTSSVTPEINAGWGSITERSHFLPMSLRPQAHDIIRTWAFYTIVKSYYHHDSIPWKNIMISGHGQDAQGQKMSKSKNNFIVAQDVIKKYSADAFRFWAASVKLGDDLPYQEKEVMTGQKFVNKLWNASKLGLMHLEDYSKSPATELFDRWLLSKLHKLILESTTTFEQYEYSKTKAEVEKFFWHTFCDYYLEIVKDRLYNPEKRGAAARKSAQQGLYYSLLSILKMMAPIMPHITEEIYQLYFASREGCKSIHLSSWPAYEKQWVNEEYELAGDIGIDIIDTVRRFKSEQQLSIKQEFSELVVTSEEATFPETISPLLNDLKAVLNVQTVLFTGETSLQSEKFALKIGLKR